MKFAFWLLRQISKLSINGVHRLARFFTPLAMLSFARRRKVAWRNIQACLGDRMDEGELKKILKEHFYHMLCMIFEYGYCWHNSLESVESHVRYKNFENLKSVLDEGKRVILLYPHFCALEICIYRLSKDLPIAVVYKQQSNGEMDRRLAKERTRRGTVKIFESSSNLRSLIRHVRGTGDPVLYLPDQDFGPKESVFAPFFGIETATVEALPRLCRLLDAKVVPMAATRFGDGSFQLEFFEAWEDFPTGDARADATRMNKFIEDRVLEHPAQYYWMHRRFKTRPEGEKPFY